MAVWLFAAGVVLVSIVWYMFKEYTDAAAGDNPVFTSASILVSAKASRTVNVTPATSSDGNTSLTEIGKLLTAAAVTAF